VGECAGHKGQLRHPGRHLRRRVWPRRRASGLGQEVEGQEWAAEFPHCMSDELVSENSVGMDGTGAGEVVVVVVVVR